MSDSTTDAPPPKSRKIKFNADVPPPPPPDIRLSPEIKGYSSDDKIGRLLTAAVYWFCVLVLAILFCTAVQRVVSPPPPVAYDVMLANGTTIILYDVYDDGAGFRPASMLCGLSESAGKVCYPLTAIESWRKK